jgi:hypothetical protein
MSETITISGDREVEIQKKPFFQWAITVERAPASNINEAETPEEVTDDAMWWFYRVIEQYTDIPIGEMSTEESVEFFSQGDFAYVVDSVIRLNSKEYEIRDREIYYDEERDSAIESNTLLHT